MATTVRNRKGSGDETCSKCESWLQHWENGTGQTVGTCGTVGCTKSPVLGGHVIKTAADDKASYITPICSTCNSRNDDFRVNTALYAASDSKNCKSPA